MTEREAENRRRQTIAGVAGVLAAGIGAWDLLHGKSLEFIGDHAWPAMGAILLAVCSTAYFCTLAILDLRASLRKGGPPPQDAGSMSRLLALRDRVNRWGQRNIWRTWTALAVTLAFVGLSGVFLCLDRLESGPLENLEWHHGVAGTVCFVPSPQDPDGAPPEGPSLYSVVDREARAALKSGTRSVQVETGTESGGPVRFLLRDRGAEIEFTFGLEGAPVAVGRDRDGKEVWRLPQK